MNDNNSGSRGLQENGAPHSPGDGRFVAPSLVRFSSGTINDGQRLERNYVCEQVILFGWYKRITEMSGKLFLQGSGGSYKFC